MIEKLIEFSAREKYAVLLFTAAVVAFGVWTMLNQPVDAIPDLSDTQVIIFSRWDRSPDNRVPAADQPRQLLGDSGLRRLRPRRPGRRLPDPPEPAGPAVSREGPIPLSADLERFLEAIGIPQVSLLVGLHRAWPEIAGPLLAGKAHPLRLRNGILTLSVRNHSWAQELRMNAPALLSNIRRALGAEYPVDELRFVVGPAESAGPEDRPQAREASALPPPGPDPDGVASVSDAQTRQSLRRINTRALAGDALPPSTRTGNRRVLPPEG